MASMNYFHSSMENLTYSLKCKSVMEMHVIKKGQNSLVVFLDVDN